MAAIPQLVFATRSPEPRSGADFVRQIVAERGEISAAARKEFARRADIAGSVLQTRRDDPADELKVFTFNRLDRETWLFARAISLGIYRKGSHQLLVHAVLLSQQVLDWLEGNPFLLDTPLAAKLGFRFLDRHPGQKQELDALILNENIAAEAGRYHCGRLAEIRERDDVWLAGAYEILAAGARAACVSADPRPQAIEDLLLHFHPDDRMELAFHTFYTHSRPVEYRLLGVLAGDQAGVRRQFRDLESIDLDAPRRARRSGLGARACRVRRQDPQSYLERIEEVRLTYLSNRREQAIEHSDADFALDVLDREGLGARGLSQADLERFEELTQRSGGGLAYRVKKLAGLWHEPDRFEEALAAAEQSTSKIRRDELERYLDQRLPDLNQARRWALVALLARDQALAPGAAGERERWRMVRQLVPPEQLRGLVDAFSREQASSAEDVLLRWAIADVEHGEVREESLHYWSSYLIWMHGRGRPLDKALRLMEQHFGSRPEATRRLAWRRLGELCRRLGQEEEAFHFLLTLALPLLDPEDAQRLVEREVELLLRRRPAELPALAPSLAQPGVAKAVFARIADRIRVEPGEGAALWRHLKSGLESAEALDRGSARALGRLLAELALLPAITKVDVPGTLALAAKQVEEARHDFAQEALEASARELSRRQQALAAMSRVQSVRAITLLLEARGQYGPASAVDGELMELAVLGKILAADLANTSRRDPAGSLDRAWLILLRLALQGTLFAAPPAAARYWLALLQDELCEEPPRIAGDDEIKLNAFLDLAWTLWSQTSADDDYRAALERKLHWAAQLGLRDEGGLFKKGLDRFTAFLSDKRAKHEQWHRTKILLRVPRKLRSDALALMSPIELTVGGRAVRPGRDVRA